MSASSTIQNPNPQVFKTNLDLSDDFYTNRKVEEDNPDFEDPIDSLEGKPIL